MEKNINEKVASDYKALNYKYVFECLKTIIQSTASQKIYVVSTECEK